MYAILGEDRSDAATLKVLVRRLLGNRSLTIKTKGYSGGSEMLRKGASQLTAYKQIGCKHFVVCHDADGPDPTENHRTVQAQVVSPAELCQSCCIVIPVQELEAWILADIQAVTKIFSGWKPRGIGNPESVSSPKEHLKKLSRLSNRRPRYSHVIHNVRVAEHLDLKKVEQKCPSFKPLVKFVKASSRPK